MPDRSSDEGYKHNVLTYYTEDFLTDQPFHARLAHFINTDKLTQTTKIG